jgi:hypothetical protein
LDPAKEEQARCGFEEQNEVVFNVRAYLQPTNPREPSESAATAIASMLSTGAARPPINPEEGAVVGFNRFLGCMTLSKVQLLNRGNIHPRQSHA